MIPGPYGICHVTFSNDSDAAIYRTLRFGFSSATSAQEDLADVAAEFGVAWQECAVIRQIDTAEAHRFTS